MRLASQPPEPRLPAPTSARGSAPKTEPLRVRGVPRSPAHPQAARSGRHCRVGGEAGRRAGVRRPGGIANRPRRGRPQGDCSRAGRPASHPVLRAGRCPRALNLTVKKLQKLKGAPGPRAGQLCDALILLRRRTSLVMNKREMSSKTPWVPRNVHDPHGGMTRSTARAPPQAIRGKTGKPGKMLVPRRLAVGTLFRASSTASLPAGTILNTNQLAKMTSGRRMFMLLRHGKAARPPPLRTATAERRRGATCLA